ncbi:MAG: response regulator [Gammaproteobacteria bacterium]
MKVMIVDDSAAMRMIVKRTLKQAGFSGLKITEAGDGQQALEQIDSVAPDLILCDWNMPELNGIDVLRKLRDDGSTVKFGFITTEGTAEMRATAREAGAQFLISKPFTADSFEKTLRPIIG